MKPTALIAIVIGIFMPISSYAQLKIVGQNAEAPDSKIDYLEHPVSFEQFFPYYSRENSLYYIDEQTARTNTIWPRNEQIYVSSHSNSGFRIKSSSVDVGLPVGYYHISGCILCEEEFKNIRAKLKAYLDTYGVDWEIKKYYNSRNWYCPSFKTLQETINTDKKPQLQIVLYILENEKGIEYYVWPHYFTENGYIIVDHYNYIQEQFKDQDFIFVNEGEAEFVLDVFKDVKVPIQSSICEQSPNDTFPRFESIYEKLKNGKKYHCSDVLVNQDSIVLVVDDGNSNKFSIALNGSIKMRFSDAYLLRDKYTVYLNSAKVNQGNSSYRNLFVISPNELEKTAKEYARIKAGQETEFARQEEQRRKDIIQRFGGSMGEKILNHKLALGMTQEMCIASIGYPSKRYTSTSEQGVTDIFYYAYMLVRFFNGELVRIDQIQ